MSEIKPCPTFTPEAIEAANIETERLCRELNITNADHIALWIERNTIPDEPMSQCASWLACRIIEAHEAAVADLTASRDRASDACASVQKERDELREIVIDLLRREAERAEHPGDCTCNNLSRAASNEYEDYRCPHQRARQFLARVGVLENDYPHTFSAFLARYEALK